MFKGSGSVFLVKKDFQYFLSDPPGYTNPKFADWRVKGTQFRCFL